MNKRLLFENLKKEILSLWLKNESLSQFVTLPKRLIYKKYLKNKIKIKSVKILESWSENKNSIKLIHNLIKKVSPYANWKQTYKEKDVGKKFLNKFAYFELFGPKGHFLTNAMSLFIIFFDKETHYTWHNHEAEELYYVISGSAKFESKNDKSKILSKKKSRFHKSFQPHSLTTFKDKCLCFVVWRNKLNSEVKIVDRQ